MSRQKRNTPCLVWPFVALARLTGGFLGLTARLLAILVGLALFIVGAILTVTIIGAIAGIPLAMLGIRIMVRGLW